MVNYYYSIKGLDPGIDNFYLKPSITCSGRLSPLLRILRSRFGNWQAGDDM